MIKLQGLRIPPGWEMVINKFLEIDVEQCSPDSDIWLDLTQDIMYMKRTSKRKDKNIAIDLGWYPDNDPEGSFHLVVIKDDNWEEPVEEFDSRSKDEIVSRIEELLMKY
ncbi:MAG: hypothetical protein IJA27_09395 [Lachnospiraceae bacterium]|nr:hypothetical protein [Lachnospiraceae bacterium]